MFFPRIVPRCHNCGSIDLEIDDRPEVSSYKDVSASCNGCGWYMWVNLETGLTWIPGRSDEIMAEIESDAEDNYDVAI